MTDTPNPALRCASVRDARPCILAEDHDGPIHEDETGYKWPTAAAVRQAAEDLRPVGLDALLGHVTANLPDTEQAAAEFDAGTALLVGEQVTAFAASVRAGALYEGADAINALPQDYECDPGRGDAAQLLRRMAGAKEEPAAEQPAPLTAAEVEQGQADTDHLAAEHPETLASLLAEIADDIPDCRARAIAADYIHPDHEFVDTGAPEHPLATPSAAPAAVPDRPALDLLTELYAELGHGHRARPLAAALLAAYNRELSTARAAVAPAVPVKEQPTALTLGDRADHAIGLYARTAVELEDARADAVQLRARVVELEHRATTARAVHTPYDDSQHCQHDGNPWPCPTIAALDEQAGR
ncbi:hypothetical protein [Streptomyces sp. NPDC057729]|uniref:hypothetical protein n=1 Tax=Streptomyces sp. NPDC057729 TaxID=3346230 RepID=UPI003688FB54